ncbi:MAG: L-lactate dehydrogenase complex protein LldF [Candidatus Azotimanducaceae bacterium]|jgi:L-lactate dehydrogenase complex protein LldF
MDVTSQNFIPLTDVALEDDNLQAALKQLSGRLAAGRTAGVAELPEFDQLRVAARDIKNHVLQHLDLYLEAFAQQVENQGGTVHWASSEDDARQIVLDLCRSVDAKRVTKSKSMVTEEINLVPFLESHGLETVETDLGEYIIQLRGEKPSHIVAPAVHLSKEQVSETFFEHHRKLGFNEKITDRGALVAEARQVLREKFLAADVGISGANFLVAETGTIVLVTNEGNAELTTALPKTHIVVTGIEKIVPTLEDVSTFVRILARSALGADISAYTSFITGPKRDGDHDGPENFHVVLVDNGRSEMLGGDFQDMLRCIRCSACLNHCPVYLSVGGHAYGSVYSGPMGAVLTPQLATLDAAKHLANASSLCGRCESVCPVMIPLPQLLRQWRDKESEQKLSPTGMRWGLKLWAWVGQHPMLYRVITVVANQLLNRWPRQANGFIQKLPLLVGAWTQHRDLRRPEQGTFSQQYRKAGGQRV